MLISDIQEYAAAPRDARREQEIMQQLKHLPEAERFALVQECLRIDMPLTLRLAKSCLQKPLHFQWLLEQGLSQADASSIRVWLDCVTPKLGFRRVVHVLTQTLDTNPLAVQKSLYWLPLFLPRGDEKAMNSWLALKTKADPQNQFAVLP